METQGIYGESGRGNGGASGSGGKTDEEMLMASINDFTQILSQLIRLEIDLGRPMLSSHDIEAIRLCACFARSNIEHHVRPFSGGTHT